MLHVEGLQVYTISYHVKEYLQANLSIMLFYAMLRHCLKRIDSNDCVQE